MTRIIVDHDPDYKVRIGGLIEWRTTRARWRAGYDWAWEAIDFATREPAV
jgi:hypothetical protein